METSGPRSPLPISAALIVNTHSRKGNDLFLAARDTLTAAGIALVSAQAVDDPAGMRDAVRRAVRDGAPMVIVGGGDGSLSGTVDELVGTNCVFAVLPLGTANSFARTLGLPLDLDGAVAVIARGRRRRIDLGMIDEDYFANAASIGLSPMIGDTVPQGWKRYLGRLGYLLCAIKCSFAFRAFRLTVDDGQSERRMWATEVRILNGPYHGGVALSDAAQVDTGQIVVQAVTGRSVMRLAWDWYAKFFRLRDRNIHVEEFRGRAFTISCSPPQRISIDGEVLARTPVKARVAEKAIDVAVPA
ncbi:MAG: diacylglycerol kinase family protein [Sphingobium sp.]